LWLMDFTFPARLRTIARYDRFRGLVRSPFLILKHSPAQQMTLAPCQYHRFTFGDALDDAERMLVGLWGILFLEKQIAVTRSKHVREPLLSS
jgi:hypothetical protein